jgi:hypothetical protein
MGGKSNRRENGSNEPKPLPSVERARDNALAEELMARFDEADASPAALSNRSVQRLIDKLDRVVKELSCGGSAPSVLTACSDL